MLFSPSLPETRSSRVARLRAGGAELVGEVERYENHRLCYVRGPQGIIVELAERIA
jgi:hypothetical protein